MGAIDEEPPPIAQFFESFAAGMRNAASEIERVGREAWLESEKEKGGDAWTPRTEETWRTADVEAFLAEEANRYRPQLSGYAEYFRLLEPDRPVKTALYYPLLRRTVVVGDFE